MKNENGGVGVGKSLFVASGLTEGLRVKLARISRGLRQVDVASLAKVAVCDVVCLEKDRYLPQARKDKILKVLGFEVE